MQIHSTPEPFSPAFGEIRYAVSLRHDEKGGEISIFNSPVTEKIGIKKATEAPVFTLQVSDYVRSQIHIEPFPMQSCGLIEAGGRVFYSCIAYRDWACSTPHTAGVDPVETNQPMCDLAVRSLDADEQDEIGWIASEGVVFARALFRVDGETVDIHLGRMEVSEPKMLALILNAGHLGELLLQRGVRWDDFSSFAVEIHSSYRPMACFEYRIRPHNCRKTRLAWWNRYGGIDFHTFEGVRSEERKIEKNTVPAGDRTLNLSAKGYRQKNILTACTTRAQAERLSGIAG